jgi:hypothetical protein
VWEADAERERRQKALFEEILVIWSDDHHESEAYRHVCSLKRVQLVKNYLQRSNLVDGMRDETCYHQSVLDDSVVWY